MSPGRERRTGGATTPASIALLAAVAITQVLSTQGLLRLPSPLFGGDLYYQMGCIRSIAASLDPMASCSTSGALPGYLPLYGTLIAMLSTITRLDVLHAMLAAAVAFKVLSVLLVAWMFGKLFDRAAGVWVAALWYAAHPDLVLRYTDLAQAVVAPLLLFALCRYLIDRTLGSAALLGLVLAIAGYTHAVVFIGGVVLFVVLAIIDVFRDGTSWGPRLLNAVRRGVLVGLLALLSLGYWWKPIFVHHGRTSIHYTEWNSGPSLVTPADRLDYTQSLLADFLVPGTPLGWILLLLTGAGAVVVFRRRDPVHAAVGWVAGTTLLYVFHYLTTQPLLSVNFVPEYVYALLWGGARFFLIAAALAAAASGLARRAGYEPGKPSPAGRRWAIATISWAAVAVAFGAGVRAAGDESLDRARIPLHPLYPSLQQFVEQTSRPNDVFLSTNELSFALSALTGRKVMVTRRAQNDAFVDMDVRNRDAALILYGNDEAKRRTLLALWQVRYLLWTDEWAATEFYFDEQGRVLDYSDPLLYFQNAEYDSALARAGVSTAHRVGWVDPALRGERYPRFPLTVVTQDNYTRPDRPWHPGLDSLLERVWTHEENGRIVAALYRIRM